MRQDALHQDKSGQEDRDAVDQIVAQWHVERPDLDPSAKQVTGRIIRLSARFQEVFDAAFQDLGISESDYGVLAPLRRAGAPYELTPTELANQRMITSGGMTAAIDRLARKGMLVRVPNPADRRGSLVRLTAHGRNIVDQAMARHAAAEHELIGGLPASDRERLVELLRMLLRAVDAG